MLDGKTTLIVNTDGEYTYLGRLVVDFDANGEIVVDNLDDNDSRSTAPMLRRTTMSRLHGCRRRRPGNHRVRPRHRGDQVRDITEAVDAVITAKDGNVFGFTDVYLEGERAFIRSQETNLGNLAADTNIHALKRYSGRRRRRPVHRLAQERRRHPRADRRHRLGDPGEKVPPLANPEAGKPAGGVSQLDVENALRFDNKLMAFDTSAAGLKAILEHGVAAGLVQGPLPADRRHQLLVETSDLPAAHASKISP